MVKPAKALSVNSWSDDGIGIIELNRPGQRNAVSRLMIAELTAAAHALSAREEIRAVVVRAQGDTFSAGADLAEVPELAAEASILRARRSAEMGAQLMRALRDVHQPTICALQGHALGAGACIAAACDFRVASADLRVSLPEVRLGMNLMWHAVPFFVELLGPAKAKRLVMSGKYFEARELLEWGFVDEVCDRSALNERAMSWATEYSAMPPVAVQMIKRSINRYSQALGDAVMHMDHDQWVMNSRAADFQDRLNAIAPKRPPKPTDP